MGRTYDGELAREVVNECTTSAQARKSVAAIVRTVREDVGGTTSVALDRPRGDTHTHTHTHTTGNENTNRGERTKTTTMKTLSTRAMVSDEYNINL